MKDWTGQAKHCWAALSSCTTSVCRSPPETQCTTCPRSLNQLLMLDERGAKTISALLTCWWYGSEIEWSSSTREPPIHSPPSGLIVVKNHLCDCRPVQLRWEWPQNRRFEIGSELWFFRLDSIKLWIYLERFTVFAFITFVFHFLPSPLSPPPTQVTTPSRIPAAVKHWANRSKTTPV